MIQCSAAAAAAVDYNDNDDDGDHYARYNVINCIMPSRVPNIRQIRQYTSGKPMYTVVRYSVHLK